MEGLEFSLTSHLQDVGFIRDAENLLGLGVVGNAELVDEVNADEVDVVVVANHKLTRDLLLVLSLDRDCVDSVKP